jgi:hypothetical protein
MIHRQRWRAQRLRRDWLALWRSAVSAVPMTVIAERIGWDQG